MRKLAVLGAALMIGVLSLTESSNASNEKIMTNPLLAPWTGPYGGVPAFDKVRVEDFKPALETAMAENLAEIDKIAANPQAPSFDNTVIALEKSGETLMHVITYYDIWSSTMDLDAFQAVEQEMAPKLAAFNDKIYQNEALFKRIDAVYNSPAKAKLNAEQQRLVWKDHSDFVHAGAKLDAEPKARVAAINERLATLYTN
ncbi:MAG: M3 family metallopeptidase, partial [Steroidobacterales bacterium]